jgi:hypothetical protein
MLGGELRVDCAWGATGECGVHLFHRFHMPDNGNSVFWYAFGSNNLWMITLSTEHSLEAGSLQRAWFEAQLSAVNRTAFPWLVVAMHRPMYTSEDEVRHELLTLPHPCRYGCVCDGMAGGWLRSHRQLELPTYIWESFAAVQRRPCRCWSLSFVRTVRDCNMLCGNGKIIRPSFYGFAERVLCTMAPVCQTRVVLRQRHTRL